MAAIPLCKDPLAALKNALRDEFPDVKSSHLTEAMAFSMGFRTKAALAAVMVGPEEDRPFARLDTDRLVERLVQFGYPSDPEFDFEMMTISASVLGLVSTMPDSAYEITYKTPREKAWRNLMVAAVNAALEQKLFTLRPGDDRFDDNMRGGHLFDFVLPNGLPARGSVAEAGFDELAIHAAVNPKADEVRHFDAGLSAGDAYGVTWLERQRGPWLQTTMESFRCRKALLAQISELDIQPHGFGDRGKVIL